ncbi:MaoC/PaaZ C-terminal domain-containing protein [Sphingomonas sp. 35-24ZXX]|uniref:MaoC/PaaZ C-terminal domain-containing protein n=1 Tax=Sphingomonas sp. 35-24ZXX TaxID=1545915 RepID=UPI00053BF346|nr:MaoC/PaaZ C-terminal domain-containing protein [Sphingomonas sp. 35-24ZXX]
MDPKSLLARPARTILHRYEKRDTILYALGVGAGHDKGGRELSFVYEPDLSALPTMAVILAYPGFWQMEPEYGIDWRRVLHAEQSCIFHQPLPVEGEVRGEFRIDAIVDKGAEKGCLLRATRTIYDQSDGALLATVRQVSFLRGDGGCGSHGEALPAPRKVPDRKPDAILVADTRPEQALIYRLSGDLNPLHVDPAVAAAGGLERPILHGLCTYGFAGRMILSWACEGRPERLAGLDCRFTAPVYPGETLEVALWRVAPDGIAFQVRSAERGVVVLDCGWASLRC